MRLAQRIVHLLTMHSAAGRLYEVDVRLRPSGKGGLLVTSIEAFADYQHQEAWTWEHQALLHARAVAGAPELRARFEAVRLEVLCQHVRRERLRDEVRSMRERMRRELSKCDAGPFDIKQDAGGIADIEFLAQYWALRWAQRLSAGGAVRGHHPPARVGRLGGPRAAGDRRCAHRGAYRATGPRAHHLSLEGRAPLVPAPRNSAPSAPRYRIWDAPWRCSRERCGIIAGASAMVATAKPLIQPNAQNQYEVGTGGPAAVLPDAADVPVEFASARVSADRGDRLGEVPLLQRRVHAPALTLGKLGERSGKRRGRMRFYR